MPAILNLDHATVESFLDQIANGAFLRDIAQTTGFQKQALSDALRKHPRYKSAKIINLEGKLDDAQQALEMAVDGRDIAAARERFRAAAWRAEHEAPELWGGNPLVNIHASGPVAIQIVSFADPVPAIEGDSPTVRPQCTIEKQGD